MLVYFSSAYVYHNCDGVWTRVPLTCLIIEKALAIYLHYRTLHTLAALEWQVCDILSVYLVHLPQWTLHKKA